MLKVPERLYLEDLHVGQQFVSGRHLIDVEQIKRFASEFDPQPFHLDEEAAKDSLFGSLAASGWHTAALTMRLIAESVPLANGVIGAGTEISWPKPTRPGMAVQVFSEIIRITPSRSKADRGLAIMRSETRDEAGEVVQILNARLIVFRRPERKQYRRA